MRTYGVMEAGNPKPIALHRGDKMVCSDDGKVVKIFKWDLDGSIRSSPAGTTVMTPPEILVAEIWLEDGQTVVEL